MNGSLGMAGFAVLLCMRAKSAHVTDKVNAFRWTGQMHRAPATSLGRSLVSRHFPDVYHEIVDLLGRHAAPSECVRILLVLGAVCNALEDLSI